MSIYDDLECPYCGHGQNICHDDGFGYDESSAHEMECYECEKTFVFHTSISFDYSPYKAPCLNGSDHNLYDHKNKHWPDHVSCKDCDYEVRGAYVEIHELLGGDS